MTRLFGTDGVRGLANRDITASLALDLGIAAARVLTAHSDFPDRRPRAVVGRDPRLSGPFLCAAITAGLASAGVDVEDLGVLPTPAIAYSVSAADADLGVVISASHNPMPDNGIKFFARGGHKLADALEDEIEATLGEPFLAPTGAAVGRVHQDRGGAGEAYLQHLLTAVPTTLAGMRIAVDCANGAASEVGPQVLRAAGADVVVINSSPDGRNINDACGSTHPQQLQAVTVASEADFGVAFDGDADRCLAVDAQGNLVDGDQIMGILALAEHAAGRLAHQTLVVTVMSNLGLLLAMRSAGIATIQTDVGDRYVVEAMRRGGYTLGGEQSGHIIHSSHSNTGDGVLTALLLAAEVARTGASLAELAAQIPRLPQTLVNVPEVHKSQAGANELVQAAVTAAQNRLGEQGRVLLRPSGTEPLVRVMVEAATQTQADEEATRIAEVVARELAL